MKAVETQFLKLLEGKKQFIITIYQRMYSWTIKQCDQLKKWNNNWGQDKRRVTA